MINYLVHNLLEEYDISLDELDTDISKDYLQTDFNDINTKKIVKKVLNENKNKFRPSLNKSELIENGPKLNGVEKKESLVKSATSKSHSRRISTNAEVYSFGQEIKAFRKKSDKIEEMSEKDEIDNISPKKKGLARKSAFEPVLTNGLPKKNNMGRRFTANNFKKNKKEDSNIF